MVPAFDFFSSIIEKMKRFSNLAKAACLLAGLANGQSIQPVSSVNSSQPMVDLGYVKYQGLANASNGINYFRSIPYVGLMPPDSLSDED